MRIKGFSLIELLVVIAIIAILAAVLFPVFAQVKAAAFEYGALNSESQLDRAALMYTTDNDDTFMLSTYMAGGAAQTWFGRRSPLGFFDPTYGLLYPYSGKKLLRDAKGADYKEYLGDHSGFGYNWGFLGSDFGINGMRGFPNAQNAAHLSELSHPSDAIVFGTSSFFYAKWLPGGDGVTYDFGFIDPPHFWNGNPNVDFRHMGVRMVDAQSKVTIATGNALVAMADGHARTMKATQMKDEMFLRGDQPTDPFDVGNP